MRALPSSTGTISGSNRAASTRPRLAGGRFDPFELAAGAGEDVLLVGHEPDFSNAVRDLTGGDIDLKKGGLAAIDGGELRVLMRPAEIKRIAGS